MRKTINNHQIITGAIVSWGNNNKNAQLANFLNIAITQINTINKNSNIFASCPLDCSRDCSSDSCTFECGSDCGRDCGRD